MVQVHRPVHDRAVRQPEHIFGLVRDHVLNEILTAAGVDRGVKRQFLRLADDVDLHPVGVHGVQVRIADEQTVRVRKAHEGVQLKEARPVDPLAVTHLAAPPLAEGVGQVSGGKKAVIGLAQVGVFRAAVARAHQSELVAQAQLVAEFFALVAVLQVGRTDTLEVIESVIEGRQYRLVQQVPGGVVGYDHPGFPAEARFPRTAVRCAAFVVDLQEVVPAAFPGGAFVIQYPTAGGPEGRPLRFILRPQVVFEVGGQFFAFPEVVLQRDVQLVVLARFVVVDHLAPVGKASSVAEVGIRFVVVDHPVVAVAAGERVVVGQLIINAGVGVGRHVVARLNAGPLQLEGVPVQYALPQQAFPSGVVRIATAGGQEGGELLPPHVHVTVQAVVGGVPGGQGEAAAMTPLPFFLQDDVDDARRTGRLVAGRGVGHDLHPFDALRRDTLQRVVVGQGGGPAVDQHFHAGVTAQAHRALGADRHRGQLVQHLIGRSAAAEEVLPYFKGFFIQRQLHPGARGGDLHGVQVHVGCRQGNGFEMRCPVYRHAAIPAGVAQEFHPEEVRPGGHVQHEFSLPVGDGAFHEQGVEVVDGDGGVFETETGGFIDDRAGEA